MPLVSAPLERALFNTLGSRRYVNELFSLLGPLDVKGTRYYVDSATGNTAYDGKAWSSAKATLAQAVALAVAGDIIYVAPGHSETLTTAVTFSVAGVSVIGIGEGKQRPRFTPGAAIDAFSVAAADILIENLYFIESTADATANIDLAAARCRIRKCHFDLGATDENCITVTATGDEAVIEENDFWVTANGPDSAITVEGAADNLTIRDNYFNGGSTTNQWDDAAIDFGSTTALNHRIHDNLFAYGTGMKSTGANPKVMSGNRYVRGARSLTGVPIDVYASASVTGTKSGTAEDPTTIADAIGTLAAAGDRVLLYPGTYTLTATITLGVANVTVQPVFYTPGQRCCNVEIAGDGAGIGGINATAAGATIQGIWFTSSTNATSDGTAFLDIDASGCTIRDCIFDGETRTNRDGINFATATKHHIVENCLFTDLATGKSGISDASSTGMFRNNIFDGTAGDFIAYEQNASPGAGGAFYNNIILGDAAAGGGAGNLVSLQATPGKLAVTLNRVFDSGSDADSFGDAAAFDPIAYGNIRDGSAAGADTAINPSVT